MDTQPAYPIAVVARRTGLSAHQIRIWERRYQAVVPQRSAGGHRLYAESDIERLLLLRQAIAAGHHIGQVAGLEPAQLRVLAAPMPERGPLLGASPTAALDRCVDAAQRLDADALEAELTHAHAQYGYHALVDSLVAPLLTRIGELWHQGSLGIASEHLTSAAVRSFLGRLQSGPVGTTDAPTLITTTPAGQRHELGALLAAHAVHASGWKSLFLGADLPTEEIAASCQRAGARALALSLVFPADDPHLPGELARLHALIGPEVLLLVGGRAAPAYQAAIAAAGGRLLPDLAVFRRELEHLRTAGPLP